MRLRKAKHARATWPHEELRVFHFPGKRYQGRERVSLFFDVRAHDYVPADGLETETCDDHGLGKGVLRISGLLGYDLDVLGNVVVVQAYPAHDARRGPSPGAPRLRAARPMSQSRASSGKAKPTWSL